MAWNEITHKFDNDDTCSYNMIWDIIPCPESECDEYSQINTTVSICRCKHLTRFGVVYQQTNITSS